MGSAQFVHSGYACFPSLNAAGAPIPDAGREFVIAARADGPAGYVENDRVLARAYKQVVQMYGYPQQHQRVGNVLIADYKTKHHVQFQFLNQKGQSDPLDAGNKVIAITIATVE